jgi:hypothetical protein
MARPRLPQRPVVIRIKLRLRPGRDNDLIAFFAATPLGQRPTAVIAAMRSGNLTTQAQEESLDEDVMADGLAGLFM